MDHDYAWTSKVAMARPQLHVVISHSKAPEVYTLDLQVQALLLIVYLIFQQYRNSGSILHISIYIYISKVMTIMSSMTPFGLVRQLFKPAAWI